MYVNILYVHVYIYIYQYVYPHVTSSSHIGSITRGKWMDVFQQGLGCRHQDAFLGDRGSGVEMVLSFP